MRCPHCQEETLPDAFLCQHCGRYLAGPATGVTQRLESPPLRHCWSCGATMEPGVMVASSLHMEPYWVAAEPAGYAYQRSVNGRMRWYLPVVTYRCTGCGMLVSFAEPNALQPPETP